MMRKLVVLAVLLIPLFAFVSGASAATWTVAKSKGDFQTIQEAVDSSSVKSGDIISVRSGTFAGATIPSNKALQIIGSATGKATTIGTNGGECPTLYGYPVGFMLDSNTATTKTRRIVIKNFSFGNSIQFPVYSANTSFVTVENCKMNKPVQGITNWDGSNWIITGNTITNLRNQVSVDAPNARGMIGIFIGSKNGTGADDNTIIKNKINGTLVANRTSLPSAAAGITLYANFMDGAESGSITGNMIGGTTANKNEIKLTSTKVKNLHGIGFNEASEEVLSEHVITGNTAKSNVFGANMVYAETYPPELKNLNTIVVPKLTTKAVDEVVTTGEALYSPF